MIKRNRRRVLLRVLLVFPLLIVCASLHAADRPDVPPRVAAYVPVGGLSGHLAIAGSETMQPLLIRLGAEFRLRYPSVKIAVEGGGTGTVITDFLETSAQMRRGDGNVLGHEGGNRVFIMASSRELAPRELARFISRHGYPPTAIPVAIDAVALYVHRDNPIEGLTLDQVDRMFSMTRKRGGEKKLTRWGELGLAGEWGEAEISLYGRDKNSGTRAFFKEQVLQSGEFNLAVTEQPGLASLLLAISRDRYGIGYGGIGFVASSVRLVPLAAGAGDPYISPNAGTTSDGAYPLRRLLYLYVNKSPEATLPPEVREFLLFVNSREGQETVLKSGFYPLTSGQVAQNVETLGVGQN